MDSKQIEEFILAIYLDKVSRLQYSVKEKLMLSHNNEDFIRKYRNNRMIELEKTKQNLLEFCDVYKEELLINNEFYDYFKQLCLTNFNNIFTGYK